LVVNGTWRKTPFHFFPFPPQQILLKPSILPLTYGLLYHGSRPLLPPFFTFPWFINYNCTTQCNKSLWSLDLTLTQHLRDEKPEPWKVRACLEVKPPRAWYYCISPNSRTLVILLQVDLASGDELETICEVVTKLNILLFLHGL
jgi:hypothetical protein